LPGFYKEIEIVWNFYRRSANMAEQNVRACLCGAAANEFLPIHLLKVFPQPIHKAKYMPKQ